jgi:hypothetical protein
VVVFAATWLLPVFVQERKNPILSLSHDRGLGTSQTMSRILNGKQFVLNTFAA